MTEMTGARFCGSCGRPLGALDRNCGYCGWPVPQQPPAEPAAPGAPVPPWAMTPGSYPAGAPMPSPVPPARPPGNRGLLVATLVVGVVVVALVAGLGVWYLAGRHRDSTAATAPSPDPLPAVTSQSPSTPTVQPSTPTPTPRRTPTRTPSAQAAALAQLKAIRSRDLSSLTLDGRWIDVLAAKSDGITDHRQPNFAVDDIFHYPDILAEHERLRNDPALGGHVYLLTGTDFGQRSKHAGKTLWTTIYDDSFTSKADAQESCRRLYPGLSGDRLDDHCLARRLTRPHS
jgi:hypothetical protein